MEGENMERRFSIPIKRIVDIWNVLREKKAATLSEIRFHLGFKYRVEEVTTVLRLLSEMGLIERLGRLWRVKMYVT